MTQLFAAQSIVYPSKNANPAILAMLRFKQSISTVDPLIKQFMLEYWRDKNREYDFMTYDLAQLESEARRNRAAKIKWLQYQLPIAIITAIAPLIFAAVIFNWI